jgi:hypothetical protein
VPKYATDKTDIFGCVIDSIQAIRVQSLDAIKDDPDTVVSFLTGYYPINKGMERPWSVTPYEHHTLVCCTTWHLPALAMNLRCVLSEEGFVNIYGPKSIPDATFQIPDAGVWREGATGYGYVSRIRAIGQSLYVCGDGRQVYRLLYPSNATDAASLLQRARFVHADAGMLQAPMTPAPAADDEAAMDAWLDQNEPCQFNDIAGTSEADIYATGDETWHFDGQQWRQLQLPADDEPMHVIKVIDADTIVLGGRNGYLLRGNAREGFVNISHHDDNHTITGLEWFDGRLFIASDAGLYTYNPQTRRQERYRTDLQVDLVDAHLLEAKDGVLWSFGYKDLAYWDSREGNSRWVRLYDPDNVPVDEVKAKKARTAPPAPSAQDVQAHQAAQAAALAWLPKAQAGRLDVGGLMARVGHKGVGEFVLAQLTPLGLKPVQVLRVNQGERYTVAVPKQGVELVLQCMRKTGQDGQAPEQWGLAEVRLLTQNASPSSHWQGAWLGQIEPYAGTAQVLRQARALWDEESANTGDQQTFFVDGPHGASWAINLSWTQVANRLGSLKVLHMGGYLPWTA